MVNFKKIKGAYVSTRSWATKAAAEKARKGMPLSRQFKSVKSRKDKRYRIKID